MFYIWERLLPFDWQSSISLSLRHSQSSYSRVQSPCLRHHNYIGLGPFVFERNISEWSLWVMNDHFPFSGFILLVTLFLDGSLQTVSRMFHHCNEDGKQSNACFCWRRPHTRSTQPHGWRTRTRKHDYSLSSFKFNWSSISSRCPCMKINLSFSSRFRNHGAWIK